MGCQQMRHKLTAHKADKRVVVSGGNVQVFSQKVGNLQRRPSYLPLNLFNRVRRTGNQLRQRFAR